MPGSLLLRARRIQCRSAPSRRNQDRDATVPTVRITVLGPVEVHYDDGRILTPPRRQERLLLAILALQAREAVPLDRLCALLWEDDPPANAHAAVRTYVARVRAVLAQAADPAGGVALESRRGGYVLAADPDIGDAYRFRRLLGEAGRTGDPPPPHRPPAD